MREWSLCQMIFKSNRRLLACCLCCAAVFVFLGYRHMRELAPYLPSPHLTSTTRTYIVDENGGMTLMDPPADRDEWAEDKGLEISELLREQEYIEFAMVAILPGEDGLYTYWATVEANKSRREDIISLIEGNIDTGKFDLENSVICDMYAMPF